MKIEIPNPGPRTAAAEPLLRVVGLCKSYKRGGWMSRPYGQVEALHDIHLQLPRRKTLAVVGKSGSGKSSLARCIACFDRPDSGEIWLESSNIASLPERSLAPLRKEVQLIFQDSTTSMNPRLTAAEIITEPLLVEKRATGSQRRERARELLDLVGLPNTWTMRLPSEMSGGQRQRLAIARALATEPKLIILDEALSGLDLSIQAQIVNLLLELQASRRLAYIYISHDLSMAGHVADQVIILESGRIVEQADGGQLFSSIRSAEGRRLLEAVLPFPAA